MKKKPLTDKSGEVRELTREDMKSFRPVAEVLPFFLVPFLDPRGRPGFLVALAGAVAEVEAVGMVAGVGTGAEVLGEVEVGAGAGAGREADGAVVGVEWG